MIACFIKYCITISFNLPRNGHQTCQFWTRGRKSLISSKLYACVLNLAPPITRMKTMSQPIRFKVEHARTMMNATCMVIDGLEASIQGPHSSIRPAFFYKARIPSPKIKYIRLESLFSRYNLQTGVFEHGLQNWYLSSKPHVEGELFPLKARLCSGTRVWPSITNVVYFGPISSKSKWLVSN